MDKNVVDWYSSYLISRNDQLQKISNTVVADAFFSKETFITPMCGNNFHVISRFRNEVVLYYQTLEKRTGKYGHLKWYDEKINFASLDLSRGKEYHIPSPRASQSYTMLICLRGICVSGIKPDQQVIDKLFEVKGY